MLALRIHMEFEPEAYDEVISALRSLVGPIRSEYGCRATRLLSNTGRDGALTWVEEWRDTESFEQHLRSVAFRRILAVIELASARPVVEIDEVASRRGFELVEEILGTPPVEAVEGGTS